MEQQQTSNRCWEDIPIEIMEIIVESLSLSDRIRMSTVCKYWGAIAMQKHIPTIPQIPWLTQPHDGNTKYMSFYDMSANKFHKLKLPKRLKGTVCCGSSKGWLIMTQDVNYQNAPSPSSTHDIFLFNPISGEVHQLPSLTTIPCYQQFLIEVDQYKEHNVSCFVEKVELSSTNVSKCLVAGVFRYFDIVDTTMSMVAICRPGNKQWSIFTGETEDFLFCKRTLYLTSTVEHFENYNLELAAGCDVNLKTIPLLHTQVEGVDEFNDYYLVESTSNEILRIETIFEDDNNSVMPSFHVFKMDHRTGQWQRLKNIDDQVIFLFSGGSSSVSAKDFAGVQGNCINLAADNCTDDLCHILSGECGVFYLEDGKIDRPFPSFNLPLCSKICWFTPIL
ncbi:hypothetical protein PTKIN_Ptkin02bG0226100 [Pterospermum kingtungense]